MNLGKAVIIAFITAVSLLLIDLCLCFVALAAIDTIGSDPTYAAVVTGILVTALVCVIIGIILGTIHLFRESCE